MTNKENKVKKLEEEIFALQRGFVENHTKFSDIADQ